jgi:hypothetical protein
MKTLITLLMTLLPLSSQAWFPIQSCHKGDVEILQKNIVRDSYKYKMLIKMDLLDQLIEKGFVDPKDLSPMGYLYLDLGRSDRFNIPKKGYLGNHHFLVIEGYRNKSSIAIYQSSGFRSRELLRIPVICR